MYWTVYVGIYYTGCKEYEDRVSEGIKLLYWNRNNGIDYFIEWATIKYISII